MSLTQAPAAGPTGDGGPGDADCRGRGLPGTRRPTGPGSRRRPDDADGVGGTRPGRDWRVGLGVFGLYLAISVLTWSRVWFTGHPTTTVTCGCGDPGEEVWFLRWFAYAVAHGHNPFLSTSMFAPRGSTCSTPRAFSCRPPSSPR